MSIMVTRSSMPDWEEYIEEIKPVFDSRYLTNMGVVHKKLESLLCSYLKVPYISLFTNGHLALEMAIQALGLQIPGGEVITTPFTFVSTTHAIVRNGLKPVFCDIKAEDYTMDPNKIESLITEKTVAIIPVHVYGNICDVEAIEEIAEKYGIKVIYDAAHAFGETYKGKSIGNFGDASVFSFHATKVFHTIEGGAVAFRDSQYVSQLHELKNFGIHGPEDVMAVGGNAKMDEFRAAMGICNLRHIDESISDRKTLSEEYRRRLDGVPGLKLCNNKEEIVSNYSYLPVYFDENVFGSNRDLVKDALQNHDVFARKYFFPAVNEMSCYKNKYPLNTPVAHDAAMSILTLPIYEGLGTENVNMICDIILNETKQSLL